MSVLNIITKAHFGIYNEMDGGSLGGWCKSEQGHYPLVRLVCRPLRRL